MAFVYIHEIEFVALEGNHASGPLVAFEDSQLIENSGAFGDKETPEFLEALGDMLTTQVQRSNM